MRLTDIRAQLQVEPVFQLEASNEVFTTLDEDEVWWDLSVHGLEDEVARRGPELSREVHEIVEKLSLRPAYDITVKHHLPVNTWDSEANQSKDRAFFWLLCRALLIQGWSVCMVEETRSPHWLGSLSILVGAGEQP